jgi:hypothetical protein
MTTNNKTENRKEAIFTAWTDDEATSLEIDYPNGHSNVIQLDELMQSAQQVLCDEIVGWKIECAERY